MPFFSTLRDTQRSLNSYPELPDPPPADASVDTVKQYDGWHLRVTFRYGGEFIKATAYPSHDAAMAAFAEWARAHE